MEVSVKLKEPSVELYQICGDDLTIVDMARISFNRQHGDLERDIKLIKYLYDNNHYSPFEHTLITFKVTCDTATARQVMRHRSWSFNEVSRRYTDEDIAFFLPDVIRLQDDKNRQCSGGINEDSERLKNTIEDLYHTAYKDYIYLLSNGVPREQARYVLPIGLTTSFMASCNLRSFIHFLQQRLDKHAQKEIRDIAELMLKLVYNTSKFNITLRHAFPEADLQ